VIDLEHDGVAELGHAPRASVEARSEMTTCGERALRTAWSTTTVLSAIISARAAMNW